MDLPGAIITAVPLLTFVALFGIAVHRAIRRMPRSVRPWVAACVITTSLTVATYGWGAVHLYTPDIAETCATTYRIAWDARFGATSLLPLSRRCAAGVDLVPAYVNPALGGLAVAVVASVGMVVWAWARLPGRAVRV
ncbi:hypothetical protein [Actinokineospora globicatena]|uniref:hypothetical protein n=1 Tax=Actinokineospora globicatena TaxID=103729 RepID=UPI0024A05D55|nr:hypothetical protein [Actinokineospora globicatena]MCP2302822.1 hypothetical protein [Actinokineospora globicatena]GLW78796.1 hypothetical protein Aglo01_32780 [Actinokineospora globicatena]GLW84537.1 hypothetical protein Aglo02_21770 [Actinokineospora globicatena]